MSNKITQGIEFLPVKFDIDPVDKIMVYRYNIDGKSPFHMDSPHAHTVWDCTAKSFKTANKWGIYGCTVEQADNDRCYNLHSIFIDVNLNSGAVTPLSFIEMEIDRNDIIYSTDVEIAFTKGNIVRELNVAEFAIIFPQFKEVAYWYDKTVQTGDILFFNSLRRSAHKVISINEANRNWDDYNKSSSIHGLSHSIRVERNGRLISEKTGANLKVLRMFAYYHDLRRLNNGHDPEHGLRAARLLESLRDYPMLELNTKELDELCFACEHHTKMLRTGNVTIDACFDADRLDLNRVGIVPLPERMATEIGAYFANNPDVFSAEKICVMF
jgi:uncharacterized protein